MGGEATDSSFVGILARQGRQQALGVEATHEWAGLAEQILDDGKQALVAASLLLNRPGCLTNTAPCREYLLHKTITILYSFNYSIKLIRNKL